MAKKEEQEQNGTPAPKAGVTDKTMVMAPVADPSDAPDSKGDAPAAKEEKPKTKKKQTIYTIKLIPDDNGDTKSIRLPARCFKEK